MARAELISWHIRAGCWHGLVAATERPRISIRSGVQASSAQHVLADEPGRWTVEAAIPADMISDGIHAFAIIDESDDRQLGAFTIAIGAVTGDDIVAEVAALRGEIELLKAAFRRQNRNP